MEPVLMGNEILTIDADTRTIEVPSDFLLGVETDNDAERVEFQCPKVVGDNLDLTQYHIYIHYQNAKGEKGKYLCEDIEDGGENITFSWLLSQKVTLYKGQTKFLVCAKKTETDTIVWNTTLATGNVLEGLDVDEDIVQQNDDVIEQILLRLEQIEASGGTGDISNAKPTFTEASQRQNIESGETLSTILGKIKKFFTDLKSVAFTGSYNDLSDKPNIPTNTSELTNDSRFLTAIPQEYVTETELEEKDYAVKSEIPTKLPNPNKLTFTGAVSGEYDGSSPLEVSIPSGGGDSGATNYNDLSNKPKINNVELSGEKSLEDLGIKQKYTANDVTFEDGQTFQQKYDSGELNGNDGATGATPNIQIGDVTTLQPGQQATASITGTPENPLLNLGIPQGQEGGGGLQFDLIETVESDGQSVFYSKTLNDISDGYYMIDCFVAQDTAENSGQSIYGGCGYNIQNPFYTKFRTAGMITRKDSFSLWLKYIFAYTSGTIYPLTEIKSNLILTSAFENGSQNTVSASSLNTLVIFSQSSKKVPNGSYIKLYKIGNIVG